MPDHFETHKWMLTALSSPKQPLLVVGPLKSCLLWPHKHFKSVRLLKPGHLLTLSRSRWYTNSLSHTFEGILHHSLVYMYLDCFPRAHALYLTRKCTWTHNCLHPTYLSREKHEQIQHFYYTLATTILPLKQLDSFKTVQRLQIGP